MEAFSYGNALYQKKSLIIDAFHLNECKQINRWHSFISPCIRGKLGVADALVLLLALFDKVGNEQLFVGSETRKSATDWSNKSVNLAAYLAKVGLSFFIVSKQGLWFLLKKRNKTRKQ